MPSQRTSPAAMYSGNEKAEQGATPLFPADLLANCEAILRNKSGCHVDPPVLGVLRRARALVEPVEANRSAVWVWG